MADNIFLLADLISLAQANKVRVQGVVEDAQGKPLIRELRIYASGGDTPVASTFSSSENGHFTMVFDGSERDLVRVEKFGDQIAGENSQVLDFVHPKQHTLLR